jgi:hypothetical protein
VSKRTPRRNAAAGVGLTLVTFSIGLMLAVLVAGSASAKTSPKNKKAATGTSPAATLATPPIAPADKFSVINGTVNAASDHEIVGSSAFPNFTTGAVDNYYTMAHSHVDNSPFAEGTSSPFDTGPVGQTAAAGNFQQPQYADSRWPGGPDKATYGSQGGPNASSTADNNRATADASEPSNGFSGPGPHGTKTLALPKGFDAALQQALAAWNSKWDGRLGMTKATPKVTTPRAPVTVPSSPVKPPGVTVTTTRVGGVTPPVTVPSPKLPSPTAQAAPRAPASVGTPRPPSLPTPGSKGSAPSPGGTESLLKSSTLATLVYQTDKSKPDTSEKNTCKSDTVGTTGTGGTTAATTTTTETPKSGTCTLVLSGESSMGRVTIGGGAIVIEGIHVTASITNDGTSTTPSYKAAVSVASATIGGIPVTIDEDGVHVAGQGGGLPYKQASDALNSALNKAGIQIFLVAPEVTNCSATGSGTGGGTTTGTTTTTSSTSTPTSTDQSGGTSSCGGQTGMSAGSCDQSGSGGSGGSGGLPAPPSAPAPTSTQSSTTTTPGGSCGPSDMGASCDQTSTTGTGSTNTTTTSSGPPSLGPSTTPTTTTTSSTQSSTTSSSGACGPSGTTGPSSCTKAGTAPSTTTGSNEQSATTSTTGSTSPSSGGTFQFGPGPGTNNAGEETVTATGVHIVFTQPVSPPGVPAQFVEHILGEVFVDSLASPAAPVSDLGFSGGSSFSPSSSSSSSSSSSCLGGGHSSLKASGSGLSAGGSSSGIAGSSASGGGSLGSSSASGLSSASQPNGTSTANSLPARFASALHKPLWLLLAYVVWQLLVIGTGWSLWNWRRGGAA